MQLELKHLQKQIGLTFVFVTHDQEEALTMSDRIAVFSHGRIEQLGTPTQIYHEPRTAFVADFIGEANLLSAQMLSRNGTTGRARLEGGLEVTLGLARWPGDLTQALVSIRPEKVCVSKKPLEGENVFRARVKEEIFQGVFDRLWLETENGTRLTAVVANESALLEAIHEGDEVWCALHADDLVVVSEAK